MDWLRLFLLLGLTTVAVLMLGALIVVVWRLESEYARRGRGWP